ncbi:Zinc finger, RING-type domain-containing protein [Rozella allomycis CSF55]|nr:Zinc finger, RING-type domain-containing protein [Rozella allomycis CSF55]|eukprot:EPZ32307.1 Zinc finger, RING-type domain-containing protein [Rozella allomycis CSF55]
MNHLLNFQLPDRELSSSPSQPRKPKNYQAFRKERYVQANFRFVLRSNQDYKVHLLDPDIEIPWNNILQVIIDTTEEPKCPICLEYPVAPTFTRCGHTFCSCCLSRYLSLNEKSWRKCPMCYETINPRDLKRATYNVITPVCLDSLQKFTLMTRDQGSTICLPSKQFEVVKKNRIPSALFQPAFGYSKLLIGNQAHEKEILSRDLSSLLAYKDECLSCKELGPIPALDILIQKINNQLEKIVLKKPLDVVSSPTIVPAKCNQSTDDIFKLDEETNSVSRPLSNTSYHFYQAANGQFYFFHPLDIKILKQEFINYSDFPQDIEIKVIDIEDTIMTPELKKRFKYLAHLPNNCEISFCQVDLSTIVSAKTLDLFQSEINQRNAKLFAKMKKKEKGKNEKKSTLGAEPGDNYSPEYRSSPKLCTSLPNALTDFPLLPSTSKGSNTIVNNTEPSSFVKALSSSPVSSNSIDPIFNDSRWTEPQEIGKKKKKVLLMSTGANRKY